MNWLNRLYVKWSLTLITLFVLLGIATIWLTRDAMDRYSREVTQVLNASIAMYVTGELKMINDGAANTEALKQLAHHAMIINPSVEVYLLDTHGKVISHSVDDTLQKNSVDLVPVAAFLQPDSRMPIFGDDPRTGEQDKVFSVSPVLTDGVLEGYVYVVLEGKKRADLEAAMVNSPVFQANMQALIGCLLAGLLLALILFLRLSHRLGKLTRNANTFYQQHLEPKQAARPAHDEIDQLHQAFDAMQARIDSQMEMIKQSDAMRRELMSHISHDLRTPLTNMLGYIETLLLKADKLEPAEQKHYLEITRRHGKRLGTLIADLFELAKLDSNAIQPQLEPFSMAELVQDIVQDFQLKAETRKVQLKLSERMPEAQVTADIRLIERVIANLIDNALNHTQAGGAILIDIKNEPSGVRVRISDTGEGINPNDLPFIFDRFFHSQNRQEEDLKSTGLGLAIVKRILDLHDARISVDSELNQGTTFTFLLPCPALS